MSLKDKWKSAGKNIGGAFKNFGKAMATTAKVAVGNEENSVNENGESKLKEAWKGTGKGFGEAGKSLGQAAAGTVEKVAGEDDKNEEKPKDKQEEEIVDAEVVED